MGEIESNTIIIEDWLEWFKKADKAGPFAIIHFTGLRY